MDHFAICSKEDCNYSIAFSTRNLTLFSHFLNKDNDNEAFKITEGEPMPFDAPELQKYLPSDKFCEKCGSRLLFYCPHCKIGLFTIPDAKHCKHCRGKIKTSQYDTLRRGDHVVDGDDMTTMDGPASRVRE